MTLTGIRLANKVSIVTGSGSSGPGTGTGKATAILFAREGSKVLLVDRIASRAEETLTIIKNEGGEASIYEADVTNKTECRDMIETTIDRYGSLDVLFNNVGILSSGSVVDVEEEDWDRTMNVNLKSMILTSKFAIPSMIESGGGSIINMSSIEALRSGSLGTILPYSVSKGGVITLSTQMAVHHGRDNIRVNCIAPGFIYTPMVTPHLDEKSRSLRRKITPLGTEGTAWDVAYAALFLASEESRWVTGITLPVDAGLLAASPISAFYYADLDH